MRSVAAVIREERLYKSGAPVVGQKVCLGNKRIHKDKEGSKKCDFEFLGKIRAGYSENILWGSLNFGEKFIKASIKMY
jgi:hypothetical protein